MTDPIAIPRRMQVFRDVWAELAGYLGGAIVAPLPRTSRRDASGVPTQCLARVSGQADALRSWPFRVETWVRGPMAAALGDSGIEDREMRRVAGRLSHFAEELIEYRQELRSLAREPAVRFAACRLDAICFRLLKPLRDFVTGTVDALDPEVLRRRRAAGAEDAFEISFTLHIDLDALAEVDAWVVLARSLAACAASEPDTWHLEFDDATPGSTERTAHGIVGVLAVVVLVLLVAIGGAEMVFVVLVGLAFVAIVVFALRHPLLALLALIFLGN